MRSAVASLDRLSEQQCWAALGEATVGRLAVRAADGVDMFPVNFTVHEHSIVIRTAPGSKLVDIAAASSVAFECDGTRGHDYWSVVVRGTAERLYRDSDIEQSGVLQLATVTPAATWNFIRITPTTVSGRRFTSAIA
jgi:nitroimidazol reductase NimA-like FMN-containing flavoprotein (pyridoxamine 5'-phosphate oxidase superfamily)